MVAKASNKKAKSRRGITAKSNSFLGSLSPDVNCTGLSYVIDVCVAKPLVKLLGLPRKENISRRGDRVGRLLPGLSPVLQLRIARMGFRELKRLSNSVEAIKDNLIFSCPETVRRLQKCPQFKKLLLWAYSLGAHRTDRVTKEWKKFSALLKWKSLKSETPMPDLPQDFPGFGHQRVSDDLPEFWKELCPWMEPIWNEGLKTKAQCTRLQHFITSRSMPPGDRKTRQESLHTHAKVLTSIFPESETRRKILQRLSHLIGRTTRNQVPKDYKSNAHLSLTSSASIDSPVSGGGRAAEIGVKLRSWLSNPQNEDCSKQTWFGMPYETRKGIPMWLTMCRENPEDFIDSIDARTTFREPGESSEFMSLDFENFKYEDPLYALDSKTGYQILQWSIEEGILNGCLSGSPFKSDKTEDLLRLGPNHPSIRASAIGEPGAKSRIVTVGEDWLAEFLQPASHELTGLLRYHPSATSGLTRGWQMYEYVKRLQNVTAPPKGTRHFLSSDLTTATDFCVHSYSLAMLRGFLSGVGINDPYMSTCAELLCSPRVYEGPVDEYVDVKTSRAILMGDPGAKAVLTLHNICAEYEAMLRYDHGLLDATDEEFLQFVSLSNGPQMHTWRAFVCSGDDHFGQGPRDYLRRITVNHSLNGMQVSWPQNFVSKIGGFYCEEMFFVGELRDDQIYGGTVPLHKRDYLTTPHIDAMKVRLFSPCAKEHEGKDESNPAIGKARQVQGMLAWLSGGFEALKPLASRRWEDRMQAFLPSELYRRYLPVSLGGLQTPAFHRSMIEMEQIFGRCPDYLLSSIDLIIEGKSPPMLRRVVSSFATNARQRGINEDLIETQIRETLSNAELVKGLTGTELQCAAGIPDDEWSLLRYRDKVAVAKRLGLTTIDDAINLIGRPYLFRDMIYPEVSMRHGINPYAHGAYEAVPWKIRETRHFSNVSKYLPEGHIVSSERKAELCKKLACWAIESLALELPQTEYFLPESVVVSENLCTLRTALHLRKW